MEENKMNLNNMPQWVQRLLFLLPVLGITFIPRVLNNDFYFLYKTGEYITKHGFPHKEFLTMHSSMEIIAQQWLSTVIYYEVYRLLGIVGVILLVYLCYLVISFLIYKICKMITDNTMIALSCSFVADILLAMMYLVSRPQILTYIMLLLEIFLLEKCVQDKKATPLFFLPLLSVIQVNMHAAMWGMMFVYALPYVVNSIPIRFGKWKQEPCCDLKKLLLTGIVSAFAGVINPYGTKAMFYIFSSFGIPEINDYISEMKPTSIGYLAGTVFFAVLGGMAVIALIRKEKNCFETRFVLLFSGSLIMAIMNFKSLAYFFIFGIICFSYMLREQQFFIHINQTKKKENVSDKKRICQLSVALLLAIAMLVCILNVQSRQEQSENRENPFSVPYNKLNEIAKKIPKDDDSVVLFTDFNCGSYMEFLGYHPYIDGRAEVFLKANNKEFDYYTEDNDLSKGRLDCEVFVEKYQFNYLIVNIEKNGCLYWYLKKNDSFSLEYQSGSLSLFKKKD